MGVTTEDAKNAEDAEEERFGGHTRNQLRLTHWVNTIDGAASHQGPSSSAFSAFSEFSAVISITVFRLKRSLEFGPVRARATMNRDRTATNTRLTIALRHRAASLRGDFHASPFPSPALFRRQSRNQPHTGPRRGRAIGERECISSGSGVAIVVRCRGGGECAPAITFQETVHPAG